MLSKILLITLTALSLVSTPTWADVKAKTPHSPPPPVTEAVPPPPEIQTLSIAYLGQLPETPPIIPFFDPVISGAGHKGAQLAIRDNNTTGRFTRQNFTLSETILPAGADVDATFRALLAAGQRHILVNLPSPIVKQLAALPQARDSLIYDIATQDDPATFQECRANVLRLMPSRAMRADALAQYLLKKRWNRWFLAIGQENEDRLYAAAIRRAAQRFGAKIVAEKTWQHSFDERRTPESEVPVFTQGTDYDVLVVADESGQFGDTLSYRTWQPRLVVGTQGLKPSNWHRTHEAWGALQLQNRFRELAGYGMTEQDYAAWLAVRAVGEAATRTRSVQFEPIKTYIMSKELALAGFKGVPLSFRAWDGQLRQPILLAAERSLIAVAPIEGFLHPKNELDTLGYDEPESPCRTTEHGMTAH